MIVGLKHSRQGEPAHRKGWRIWKYKGLVCCDFGQSRGNSKIQKDLGGGDVNFIWGQQATVNIKREASERTRSNRDCNIDIRNLVQSALNNASKVTFQLQAQS